MKCSLDIAKFLEEISSFQFYCFPLFLCITHLKKLSYLSVLFSVILHSDEYILPFLLCFSTSLLFTAICKASSDNLFAFLHFFFLVMVLIPSPAQCYVALPIVLQALCLSDLVPSIYLSLPLCNRRDLT